MSARLLGIDVTSTQELECSLQSRSITAEDSKAFDRSDRLAARAAKNWAESDRIRDELAAMGIALKDNKDGTTTWEVKR